jgi:hypothetical protein
MSSINVGSSHLFFGEYKSVVGFYNGSTAIMKSYQYPDKRMKNT